jgi:phosphoglycolate phosphatase-like HAD superfamily hydrolase
MPGARELLEALDGHDHLHLALLTGNYREAAEIKLQHFELWDFFEWGAFSDDAADRNALVPIAKHRAGIYDIPVEAIQRVIVIGDTPHDIECARVAGAQCIAVATGGYTVEQLREYGADTVLTDLSDTQRVVELLIG